MTSSEIPSFQPCLGPTTLDPPLSMLWEISFKYILQTLETVWDTKGVFKYGAACETGWPFFLTLFKIFVN